MNTGKEIWSCYRCFSFTSDHTLTNSRNQHKFFIENKDGSQEIRTSTLLDFGQPVGTGAGPSSMAKLVGIPCGAATQLGKYISKTT